MKLIVINKAGKPSIMSLLNDIKGFSVLEKFERKGYTRFRLHTEKGVEKSKANYPLNNATIIRWGNRIPLDTKNCTIYNQASAIAKATNKKLTREILNENKISIPKLVTDKNFSVEDLPIIGRPSHHSRCKNLLIFKTENEFKKHYNENHNKGWYYSKYIDKDFEFRIHCAHGKVLSISEKPKPNNHTKENPVIGWGYSVVEQEWRVLHWSEYKAKYCKIALDAVKALGLDFGAVDIIIKDKIPYVLEINTAGSLTDSPYLRKRYSLYFNWLFSKDEKREHWDYSKFESGKSMAWKNFQLNQ